MSPLIQALDQGYPPEEILGYISKALPNMAPAIKKATRSGYAVREILGFLSKNFDNEDRKGMSESQRHAANKRSDAASVKHGLKLAATAVAAPLAASAASSALSRALPTNLTNGLTQTLSNSVPNASPSNPQSPSGSVSQNANMQQQPQLPNQAQVSPQQPPLINVNAANIPEPSNIKQPEIKPIDLKTLLKDNYEGFKGKVSDLLKSGNDPQTIGGYFKKFSPGMVSKLEKEAGQPIEKLVEQFVSENPVSETPLPNEKPEEAALKSNEPAEPVKIEKNSVVSSPNGIGELKELRNGVGLIEVDGKLHKVKEEDLESSPLPEKDLAELYDNLISGIEGETGEDVSRMVQWAGYNPDTNTLQFLPHSGKLYKYGNISPEDAALLTDILSVRKSSGSNFIGVWKKDSKSPIGAALNKLIKKLQSERGGKGNEYEETHEPIYSAYEPAIEAKKEKMRKKKKI